MCIGKRNYRLYVSYILSLGVLFVLLYIQIAGYFVTTHHEIEPVGLAFNILQRSSSCTQSFS